MTQTLHGTAIYADQLGCFTGVNGAAYIWQSLGAPGLEMALEALMFLSG